jgi:hypothetical protein
MGERISACRHCTKYGEFHFLTVLLFNFLKIILMVKYTSHEQKCDVMVKNKLLLQENYLVTKMHKYGDICKESKHQDFEFELRGDKWTNITKGL